jgi:hypothetical protein
VLADFKPGAFGDGAYGEGEHVTPEGVQGLIRVYAYTEQGAAQAQHRRRGPDGYVQGDSGVRAGDRCNDGITYAARLRWALTAC